MASKLCNAARSVAAMLRGRRVPAVMPTLTYTLPMDRLIEEETIPGYDSMDFCPVLPGQVLNNRYEAISKLGWGTTSTVWLARDLHRWRWQAERMVALKLINRSTLETDEVDHELMMSQRQQNADRKHKGAGLVRTCIDHFKAPSSLGGAHMCLVYEPMREPLTIYRRRFNTRGAPLPIVKAYIKILLMGLDFLHSECKTIHTDLKLDNILVGFEDVSVLEDFVKHQLRADSPCKKSGGRILFESKNNFGPFLTNATFPRITDFGLAQEVDGTRPLVHPIQPDVYRAPEVIVGGSWDYSVDIWNLGAMIWDLAGATDLFQPISKFNGQYSAAVHLAQMTALLGPAPPAFVARQGQGIKWRWSPAIPNDAGQLCDNIVDFYGGPFFNPETGELLRSDLIPEDATLANSISFIEDDKEKAEFMRFVRQMLQWEPEKRKSARELFDDPWLINPPRQKSTERTEKAA